MSVNILPEAPLLPMKGVMAVVAPVVYETITAPSEDSNDTSSLSRDATGKINTVHDGDKENHDTLDSKPIIIHPHLDKYMNYFERLIKKKIKDSHIIRRDGPTEDEMATTSGITIPTVDESELLVGKKLGNGSFCDVQEVNIKSWMLLSSSSSKPDEDFIKRTITINRSYRLRRTIPLDEDGSNSSFHRHRSLRFVAEDIPINSSIPHRRGSKRTDTNLFPYALKRIKKPSMLKLDNGNDENSYQFALGLYDFYMEVQYLSALQHPHIVSVIATSSSMSSSSHATATTRVLHPDHFVILDKLSQTLLYRIDHIWKHHTYHNAKRNPNGLVKFLFDKRGNREQECFVQRCTYAFHIGQALQYLHEKQIMYRDLKPENIGFDQNDAIQLFDFGLAREYDPKHCSHQHHDGLYYYKYTAATGSYYYMDPNVAMGLPYNELCDVYSFCLLLWHMIELCEPYAGYKLTALQEKVWISQGLRPRLCHKHWNTTTPSLKSMIHSGWSYHYHRRPTMKAICDTLEQVIATFHHRDHTNNHNNNNNNKKIPAM